MEVRNTITRVEQGEASAYSYAYDHVMKISLESSQREKRRWIALSRAFQNWLHHNDYWILKIVDGVDNVHINDEDSKIYYRHMLLQAFSFIRTRAHDKNIHFLASRERTYVDICNHPIQQDTHYYTGAHEILHVTSSVKSILERRYDFACKNLIITDALYDRIAAEICASIEPEANAHHHNNVRAFLYNKMTLIAQTYYRLKQLGGSEESHISGHVKTLEKRNRYLNGRLFLDTKNDWHKLNNELGLCCMNIFYFDNEKYPCHHIEEWHGLCETRILQLLSRNPSADEKQISGYLSEGLGYDKKFILDNMDDLRAFGMIDSKLQNNRIRYVISHQGHIYLFRSYAEVDALYYFGLDTPLPEEFVEQCFIQGHNNKFHQKTHYPYAATSTAITVFLFLLCVNEVERRRLLPRSKLLEKTYGVHLSPVDLPFHQADGFAHLLLTLENLIDAADPEEIDNISAFLDRIISSKNEDG